MTATAHAIVAGAIATKFPDPIVALPIAFISHFIMDTVPHWDIGTNWRDRSKHTTGVLAVGETIIGATLAYLLFSSKVAPALLAATIVVSILPDWLETPWYIFFAHQKKHEPAAKAGFWEKLSFAIYKTENVFHTKTQFPLGVLTQVATVLFFLILLS